MNAPAPFRYDPFSREAMRDPHSLYPILRAEHPAYFIPEYDTYVFSRFEDVWTAFLDTEHYSEAEGQLFSRETLLKHHHGQPPAHQLEPLAMFTALDRPVHTEVRRATAPPFLKGPIAKLEPQITAVAQRRLTELLPRGRFDLNTDFASHVSVGGTALAMELPIDDVEQIITQVNAMVARDPDRPGPPVDAAVHKAALMDFLKREITRRRAGRGPESRLTDRLIAFAGLDRPLSDDEVATQLLAILAGGVETVPKVIAGGFLELSRRPAQVVDVLKDIPANTPPLVEEMLRYNAPAQWFGRLVKAPTTLGGVTLQPGQRVILLLASANRDEHEFEDADEFRWNRKARRLVSFGIGPHFCIGLHLARLECQVIVREFLSAVGDRFAPEPEAGELAASEFQIGWTRMPVRVG